MAPSLDATTQQPSSLTARRPAATNLGSMSLPPLPFRHTTPQKPMAFNDPTPNHAGQASFLNSGNLLTPPSTLSGDTLSPISGLMNSTAGGQSFGTGSPNHWVNAAASNNQNMNMTTGITPSSWTQSTKGLFSPPSAGTLSRTNTTSPSVNHGLPPPPPTQAMNELGARFSPYGSQPTNSLSAAAIAAANQQAYNHNTLLSPTAQHGNGNDNDLSALSSPPLNGGVHTSTANSLNFTTYSTPASAQAPQFNFNSQPSPADGAMGSQLANGQRYSQSAPPQQGQYGIPNSHNSFVYRNPAYLPMTNGAGNMQAQAPMMSNMANPGQPMTLIGINNAMLPGYIPGYHSGVAANMISQGQPKTDRPFSCNECPQSFNRNHDLKRHKRIHLAVKPYPCDHCDKSFSRKDALKRHILVKSCGSKASRKQEPNSPTSDESVKGEGSVKSE